LEAIYLEENLHKFEEFALECISKTNLPSLSVALVKDGKIVYSKGFGVRNKAYGFRATPNTLYAIGSVT